MRFKAPRGTHDILPAEQKHWRFVVDRAEKVARTYGYRRIDTPVFEQAGLFTRSVGAGTDIVEKETYTFTDRGGEELTLCPEGTASVCRAYIEHGMQSWPQPVRLFYFSPIFRYERPQSGRFRQHYQFGVEVIGDSNPAVDAEVIELAWRLSKELGLTDLDLLLNSIGCKNCRPGYLLALREYFHPFVIQGKVCPDCRVRSERNILRMLDCKRTDFACQDLIVDAPVTTQHLCNDCHDHWNMTKQHLNNLGIPFLVTHRLVRGLDYYSRTTFEIQPRGIQGAQTTILGGGRYDGLFDELGGPSTPGIGFGSGIERWVLGLQRQEIALAVDMGPTAVVISQSTQAQAYAVRLSARLRADGIETVLAPQGRSLRGQMRHASAMGADYALIVGDDEVDRETVQVKQMATGRQIAASYGEVHMKLVAESFG